MCSEDSFHKSARFLLKEAPQDQFRFFEQKTRNILDLVSDTTKKKRMVEVPVLLKDGLVLAGVFAGRWLHDALHPMYHLSFFCLFWRAPKRS